MRALLAVGGLVGLGVVGYALFGGKDKHPADADAVPSSVVQAVAAAVESGDPVAMRQTAKTLRAQGFALQASSLEDAASELERAISATPEAPVGRELPPMRITPQAPAPTKRQVVQTTAATTPTSALPAPNPAPRADSPDARKLAGSLALLLNSMTPAQARASSKVTQAVKAYQTQEKSRGYYVGNIDGLYGPKTALTLAKDHGIVPPPPLTWPKKDTKSAQAQYVAELSRFAAADPQRREEWNQASHVA